MKVRGSSGLLVAVLLPAVLLAHDTWLIPAKFRLAPGESVHLKLATSEAFPASETAAAPERIARFTLRTSSGTRNVEGYRVEGTFLVAEVAPTEEGHAVVVAETRPRFLEMPAKDFNEYLRHEELKSIMEARRARGHWNAPGRERYRKITKTVLCVGKARDKNYKTAEELWLEIIPLQSPCEARVGSWLTVEVRFQGRPLVGVPVAAGYEGVTGHKYPAWARTTKNGRLSIPFNRPGVWFIRTLHMVPATDDPEADWHSAFSTLTFEVRPAP